jgi:HAE1 family hydrophobic/amphiphilic exporter-1
LEEEIHVLLEEEQLRRTGISIQQVIDRMAQENINVAGGTIQEGRTEYLVRTLNEFEDLAQIENTIVATFEGREVRVGDIGRAERTHRERQIVTRTDGGESVQIEIFKEADANIVALAKRVKALVGEVETAAPADTVAAEARSGPRGLAQQLHDEEGASLKLVADRSLFIESSIQEVRNTAILGGFLAVLVLFMFLRNVRTTVIIAVSIPISLLVTFAPLNALGVTLNIMSLGGLARSSYWNRSTVVARRETASFPPLSVARARCAPPSWRRP